MQGDRSTGGTKPATLETGAEIAVPLFITTGEKVKVDTRDGRYLGRVTGHDVGPLMSARSKARKRALDVLFEAEQRGADPLETLAGRLAAADPPVAEYTVELVEGVVAHRRAHRRAARRRTPRAGRWTGCRPSTGRSCGWAPSSCSGATTCPTPW